ncbi:hypothetical protein [Alloactinosynnema sp. L-07]|uniref:hypothetical protein n=1 Tax=Alloactinosynnema sp. L-07 TaxID=1653480 RepID=UPI00065F02BA|nr:hypothetical protein [Alloactinosynnema sp. L-07]CRK59108.1 hypothetical protein [Alloactinosynnema sp. L-07]
MTTGLRSRFMAPVYALIISFAAAALLGIVVRPGTAASGTGGGTTGDAGVTVRLMTPSGEPGSKDLVPATDLANVVIHVVDASVVGLKVATNGEAVIPARSASKITVCAELPQGWTVLAPTKLDERGRACTKAEATDKIILYVKKVGR